MSETLKDKVYSVCDSVSMDEVISTYVAPVRRKKGRIPCPLHDGHNDNFAYNKVQFYCFVCGRKGNAISFVAQLYDTTNVQAAKLIDKDFHLGIFEDKITFADHKKLEQRRAAADAKRTADATDKLIYGRCCSNLRRVDKLLKAEQNIELRLNLACFRANLANLIEITNEGMRENDT